MIHTDMYGIVESPTASEIKHATESCLVNNGDSIYTGWTHRFLTLHTRSQTLFVVVVVN